VRNDIAAQSAVLGIELATASGSIDFLGADAKGVSGEPQEIEVACHLGDRGIGGSHMARHGV